jgi:putative endonuclease
MRARIDRRGEDVVALVAEQRGFVVLARNWRGGGGELDLILEEGATIVFVEVKTRTGDSRGSGFEAVTRAKQRKMTAAALAYLGAHSLHGRACRFDVVAVEPHGDRCSIEWIRDAFFAADDAELDA